MREFPSTISDFGERHEMPDRRQLSLIGLVPLILPLPTLLENSLQIAWDYLTAPVRSVILTRLQIPVDRDPRSYSQGRASPAYALQSGDRDLLQHNKH